MLSQLEQDPPDTRQVIQQYEDHVSAPRHPVSRLFLYLFFGFVGFVTLCALAVWGMVYYFHIDIKALFFNTKIDAYSIDRKQSQNTVTPPAKNSWSTYTNSIQRYSFMYPSDWIIQNDTDETIILYPPGSMAYANLTQADIGAGLGPKMTITIVTRPYMVPDSEHTMVTTTSGLTGYTYKDDTRSVIPIVDFPFKKDTEILEFQVHNIGQENINEHLKMHQADIVVKDISQSTFDRIIKSLQIPKQ